MKDLIKLMMVAILLPPAISSAETFNLNEVRYERGIVWLFMDKPVANRANCTSSNPIAVDMKMEGSEQLYSMALTSVVSAKSLNCWVSASQCITAPWGGNRPKVYACGINKD